MVINESKNNITVINEFKSGSGWAYNETGYTYDIESDPLSGMDVTYERVGFAPIITNESKVNVAVTNESKNAI